MEISDYITHYYYPDKEPFLNLSELTPEERDGVIIELNKRVDNEESKRDFPEWYMSQRLDSEKEMLKILKEKVVTPERELPHYFVLGNSPQIEGLYKSNFKCIQIPISEFEADELTFTIRDSYWSIGKILMPDVKMNVRWFDQKLLSYQEACKIITDNDVDVSCTESLKKIYTLYIEAQVWSDRVINKYR